MIGISISFDLGRYHANPWGAHVNEGLVEWPPSPWRILRALYAVSRTNVDLTSSREVIDRALGRLLASDPPVYSLPASTQAHTRHFVPSRGWSPAKPGETDLIVDAFQALAPEDELTVWWPADLIDDERDALEEVVAGVGHLGRSESVCSARLTTSAGPEEVDAWPADENAAGDVVTLLCPAEGASLEDVAVSVAELRRQRLVKPPTAREVAYEVNARAPNPERPTIRRLERLDFALFRLGGTDRPGLTDAVAVAQTLRSGLQGRFGQLAEGAASRTLSGHLDDRPRLDQHQHAHYLALPDAEGRRVEHLAVWAPEGLGPGEIDALASLRHLAFGASDEPLRLALAALGQRERIRFPELLGPARQWRSLTPFGLVRYPKVRGGRLRDGPEDQVRLELARRGLPEPVHVTLVRGSWHRFRSSRVGTSRLDRARVFGMRLEFAEPVTGPLALGSLCHFGLGVFVPDDR